MAEADALDAAWAAAWSDFLSNRIAHAERRAAPFLLQLPATLSLAERSCNADDDQLAEKLVTLADLAHIAGAARNDASMLSAAVDAYDAHLQRRPSNREAPLRMRAETLLRCKRYADAFAGFRQLYEHSLAADAATDGEQKNDARSVAPFQLIHDAQCIEHAVELGADPSALATAARWRELAEQLSATPPSSSSRGEDGDDAWTRRRAAHTLTAPQRALLGAHGAPLPLPPAAGGSDGSSGGSNAGAAAGHSHNGDAAVAASSSSLPSQATRALRADIDWIAAANAYATQRAVVIDDLLSAATLSELQAYTRHGAHFRTVRSGYLGAFPSDGTTHPLILALAEELVAAAPTIFGKHALAMWWIFKYDETNPQGIGIHADPAAVNINLWLTDDAAWQEGGGLAIYSHVPALEVPTHAVNRTFESAAHEEELRDQLSANGPVTTIPYKCNRAAVFVSDQYHESLPFRFAPGYAQRRANLTLLFGDRWSPLPAAAAAAAPAASAGIFGGEQADSAASKPRATMAVSGTAAPSGDDGWDVFD